MRVTIVSGQDLEAMPDATSSGARALKPGSRNQDSGFRIQEWPFRDMFHIIYKIFLHLFVNKFHAAQTEKIAKKVL